MDMQHVYYRVSYCDAFWSFASFSFQSAIWCSIFRFSFSSPGFYENLGHYCQLLPNILTNWKKIINNSKDGLLLDTCVKVLKKYIRSCIFHEIMPKCPEVEPSSESFSQSLLKVIKAKVLRNIWIFKTLISQFMFGMKSWKTHRCVVLRFISING